MTEEAMQMKEWKLKIHWQAVALGTGIGMLTVVCAAALSAALMAKGALDPGFMGMAAAWILVGAALMGSLTAVLGGGGAVDGALTALGELVVLVALNGALNGWQMEGVAVTALVLAGGCGAGLLLTMGKGSGRKRRRKKNRDSAQKRRR